MTDETKSSILLQERGVEFYGDRIVGTLVQAKERYTRTNRTGTRHGVLGDQPVRRAGSWKEER